jgi:hypothetical protein
MILGEKSAAVTGGECPSDQHIPESGYYAFSEVVDKACEGLKDRQVKYSIRRIREMEDRLCGLERELNDFLISQMGK